MSCIEKLQVEELFPAAQKKTELHFRNFNKQKNYIFFLAAVGWEQGACFPIPRPRDFLAMVSQYLPGRSSPKQNKAVPCLSSPFKLCCNQERDECVTSVRDSDMETCSITYRVQIPFCVLWDKQRSRWWWLTVVGVLCKTYVPVLQSEMLIIHRAT